MPRDDAILLDMYIASTRAVESLEDITNAAFLEDWKTQSIAIHQLMILGEAVKRLSSEFTESHPSIPWRKIAGTRDVLIHGYDVVDIQMVWVIIKRELPGLIEFLRSQIPSIPPEKQA